MNKYVLTIIITAIFLLCLYFIGFEKISSKNMNWYSFKLNTKYFLSIILIYIVTLYIVLKNK